MSTVYKTFLRSILSRVQPIIAAMQPVLGAGGIFMGIVFIWISVLDISMKWTSFQLPILLILYWFIILEH